MGICGVHHDGKQKINVIIWNQYWKQTRTHSAGPSIFYYQSRHRLLASLILHNRQSTISDIKNHLLHIVVKGRGHCDLILM
jgi:hypothetical protein